MTFYRKEVNMERLICFFFRILVSLKFLHLSFQNTAKNEMYNNQHSGPNHIEVYWTLYMEDIKESMRKGKPVV